MEEVTFTRGMGLLLGTKEKDGNGGESERILSESERERGSINSSVLVPHAWVPATSVRNYIFISLFI